VRVETALQYNKGETERVVCYANNQKNPEGGTHLSGFRAGLTRTLKAYGEKTEAFKKVEPEGVDFPTAWPPSSTFPFPIRRFESTSRSA